VNTLMDIREKRIFLKISCYQTTSAVPLEMRLIISTDCMSQSSSRQAGSSSAIQELFSVSLHPGCSYCVLKNLLLILSQMNPVRPIKFFYDPF